VRIQGKPRFASWVALATIFRTPESMAPQRAETAATHGAWLA
jgi:hypothetical protein